MQKKTLSGLPILPPLPLLKNPEIKPEEKAVKKIELPPLPPIGELPKISASKIETPPQNLPALTKPSTKLPHLTSSSSNLPSLTKEYRTSPDAGILPVKDTKLVSEIKSYEKELPKEIEKEIKIQERIQIPLSPPVTAKIGGVVNLSEFKPLPALTNVSAPLTNLQAPSSIVSSLPVLPSLPPMLPASPKGKEEEEEVSALKIAQKGAIIALSIEPKAAFQPISIKELVPEEGVNLSSIASPANLPGPNKKKEPTPKVKIPKLKTPSVKPSSSFQIQTSKSTIPSETTIIPPIPITSPSAMTMAKVSKATTSSADVMKNIMAIDLDKLNAERGTKRENSYTVDELKAIAGSLNITKTGNKKDLVERIKTEIMRVNPTAFNK